jgi:putative oxidoreductase
VATLKTDAAWVNRVTQAIPLVRVLVGWVFLSEGIQKFLFPDSLGAGRFVKIGIPWPHVVAPFVGVVELCVARFIVDRPSHSAFGGASSYRYCALYSTKIVTFAKNGFWSTLHEARTDVSMILGLIFLLLVGVGSLSIDARLASRKHEGTS